MIELKNIHKKFGNKVALNNISLKLQKNQFLSLIGTNGAGKTTLLRIIAGLEYHDQGQIISSHPDLSYISESVNYDLNATLFEILDTLKKMSSTWDEQFIKMAFDNWDLHVFPQDLSRGQKMFFAFAVAAAQHPPLYLIDEITSVLDNQSRKFVLNFLSQEAKNGALVIMVTNMSAEAQLITNHLVLLDSGVIRLSLPTAEIPQHYSKLRKIQNHEIFESPLCYEVHANTDGTVSHLITQEEFKKYKVPPEIIDRRNITIEDLYTYYTRGSKFS